MKREREGAGPGPMNMQSIDASTRPQRRCIVDGKEHGFPAYACVVEETEEVTELHTLLLRFPCFDFFTNVHLCETADDTGEAPTSDEGNSAALHSTQRLAHIAVQETSSTARMAAPPSSRSGSGVRFAPEALHFAGNTLSTDTPIVIVNGGTPSELIFEGQWSEVCGEDGATTNRAVVRLSAKTVTPSALSSDATGASPSAAAPTTLSTVASLLPHAVAGVTADEERRLRTEQQHGWIYDRVDVPSAVLVMHRVR